MANAWIQTYTGYKVDLECPDANTISIGDIAHALANICRFSGHTNKFYSVAQHSVLVSDLMPREWALEGLLHDASEAYIGDLIGPLKRICPDYKRIEVRIQNVIKAKYKLKPEAEVEVDKADVQVLYIEAKQLIGLDLNISMPCPYEKLDHHTDIVPLCPKEAEDLFLGTFEHLSIEQSRWI